MLYEVITEDVTSYRHLINQLQQSDERHRNLIEHSLAGIVQIARDGDLVYVNPAFVKMFGYSSQQEMMELNISVLFVSEDKWQTIQRNLVSENRNNFV